MANTANVLSVHSDVLAILQQAVKDSAPTIMNLAQAAVTSAQDLHKVLKDKDEEMERLRNQLTDKDEEMERLHKQLKDKDEESLRKQLLAEGKKPMRSTRPHRRSYWMEDGVKDSDADGEETASVVGLKRKHQQEEEEEQQQEIEEEEQQQQEEEEEQQEIEEKQQQQEREEEQQQEEEEQQHEPPSPRRVFGNGDLVLPDGRVLCVDGGILLSTGRIQYPENHELFPLVRDGKSKKLCQVKECPNNRKVRYTPTHAITNYYSHHTFYQHPPTH